MGFIPKISEVAIALKVGIIKSSDVAQWCTFVTEGGQAEFKIRGIGYKPFQVALEKAGNQITSKGYDVMVMKRAAISWTIIRCMCCSSDQKIGRG